MAIANAVSAGARASADDMYTDASLMSNLNLQKSLLGASPLLRQRFDESLKGKPDVITVGQFSTQFWSTRVHLLRAHAIEKSQHQGSYNVLSMVKPIHENDKLRLELNKEQIQLIFKQHPLMRRVYDDLVPKSFSEEEFWAKFVVSRLFKQLKGEKITELDAPIPKLDHYLGYDEKAFQTQQFIMEHVPRFMDIEGNEQNHSKRMGNAPDTTMKPSSHDKVPILRALNNMSEKMMVNVAPSDAEAHAPVGLDEETFNELQLRDLQRLEADNRVRLRVSNEQHYSTQDRVGESGSYRAIEDALQDLRATFKVDHGLHADYDEREQVQAGLATTDIISSVKQRVLISSNAEPETGLSPTLVGAATMTHNTTVEFLHYFWSVYLSGDESRAGELAKLAETLGKSLDRIAAVAGQVEQEKAEKVADIQKQVEDFNRRTGKRKRADLSKVGGGQQAVEQMLAATTRAVKFAEAEYRHTVREQSTQQGV
jgi:transcription initiation factor TFIIH subunit 1